jgi:hypothetical protein
LLLGLSKTLDFLNPFLNSDPKTFGYLGMLLPLL